MKRLLVISAVLVVIPAAAATTLRERTVVGPVSTVGITGVEVGYADEYRPRCHEVRRWDTATRADVRVATHCFASTSTGSGVAGVSVAGGRELWLTYIGGNTREWSLWTKRGTARAKRIAFEAADVDGPAPIVLGRAWDEALPYTVGNRIAVLAPDGSRKFSLDASQPVSALTAHSRGYAAVLADGTVLTISLTGRPLGVTTPDSGGAQSAVLAAPGLIVETVAGLEIHRGAAVTRIGLPAGARWLGYSEDIVAYAAGRQLRLRRLASGKDVLFRTLAPRFDAQLGRRGLAYASGRTLGFAAWATVSASV
ncbi:MAG TPA: hypothetical protein VM049_00395 [Gaiellaceae bacterium]|nr:hypothetical protein [Gaiellaceae bacterium]